jgi:hypothetical protein
MDMEMFYKVMNDEIPIETFEQWVYATPEIEDLFSTSDYLDLLSIKFHSHYAKHDLNQLLKRIIDPGNYETYRITSLLKRIIAKSPGCENDILFCYDLYCRGYAFFDRLAFGYASGLAMAISPPYSPRQWQDLSESQKNELLNSLYPHIIAEANNLLNFILEKKIILTGIEDCLCHNIHIWGHYNYLDHRTEAEIKTTAHA